LGPINALLQLQIKDFIPFAHFPPILQGFGSQLQDVLSFVSQFLPVKPGAHLQVKELAPSLHVPPF